MEAKLEKPNWNDDMAKELADIVGKMLIEWDSSLDLEECVEDAYDILEYYYNEDGYNLAKEFEDKGYDSDSNLVDILDGVSYEKHNIKKKYLEQWVSDNSVKLDYEIGDIVECNLIKHGKVECEVVKLYPETAEYGLWFDGLGYEKGKGHRIVSFEKINKKL